MEQNTESNAKLSTRDLEVALKQVLPLGTCIKSDGMVDVSGGDGYRHTVLKIRPGLYLTVDIHKDVIVSLVRSSDAGIARDMLENFGDCWVDQLHGFDLGSVHEGDMIP